MNLRTTNGTTRAASLIELLVSMAILSFIFIVLSSALELSLGQFRRSVDRSENVVSAQASLDWIRRDLESIVSQRFANLARLPDDVTDNQREFFENRLFYPVEIDRRSGTLMPEPRSFQNAHPDFDSIAFMARLPMDAQFSVAYDSARRADEPESVIEAAVSWEAMARASIIGYYVAYTYDSPLAGERRAAMRLHRHYRPGDSKLSQGYASGFAIHASQKINDAYDEIGSGGAREPDTPNPAAVRQGKFANDEIPFLFSRFVANPASGNSIFATQPWPKYPIPQLLKSPPPTLYPDRGTADDWDDRGNIVHETVFHDEPLAHNVVRFEVEAYREVESESGSIESMDAVAINEHLELSGGDEWPALVTPTFIDVTLSVVKETAARRLRNPEDWIVDWSETDENQWSESRKLIEDNLQTFRLRIPVSRFSR